MKIISGNLKAKNIQINCRCCNACYELENQDDFEIRQYVYAPVTRDSWSCEKIPEYEIKCPVCGYTEYIGLDPLDCGDDFNEVYNRGALAEIIFSRPDWVTKYKIES